MPLGAPERGGVGSGVRRLPRGSPVSDPSRVLTSARAPTGSQGGRQVLIKDILGGARSATTELPWSCCTG